jgi:hypothetical protein
MFFLWDDWNRNHVDKHQVEPLEAEYIVRRATPPYPRNIGSGKYMVRGATIGSRRLQVIYVKKLPSEIDISLLSLVERLELMEGEAAVYIIHARDLDRRER